MRFLMMHKLSESAPEWTPTPEFIEKMGAFIGESVEKGIFLSGEGVHKSDTGARVRKGRGAKINATDGPFTEAKEVIGGFALLNFDSRADAVEFAKTYADLFDEVEIEIRQVVEEEDIAAFTE